MFCACFNLFWVVLGCFGLFKLLRLCKLFSDVSSSFFFFAMTVRIGTMHVLRMHVTETEETQGLRFALYFVFLLSFLYNTI